MSRSSNYAMALALLGLSVSSSAQQDPHVMLLPDQIVWGPASPKLPAGAQIAVIVGDMSKPGELYVFRAKLPDGYSGWKSMPTNVESLRSFGKATSPIRLLTSPISASKMTRVQLGNASGSSF